MRIIPWLALTVLCECGPSGMTVNQVSNASEICKFRSGQVWLDTDGRPIQAHGGGMLLHDGVYYWYGESRDRTVFKDDDGKAYVIFGSGWHTHVQIADLTDD